MVEITIFLFLRGEEEEKKSCEATLIGSFSLASVVVLVIYASILIMGGWIYIYAKFKFKFKRINTQIHLFLRIITTVVVFICFFACCIV